MRLFLGVAIESEARERVRSAVEAWNARAPLPGKKLAASNWHLTLVFLGQVPTERSDALIRAMDEAAARAALGPAFELEIARAGTFPEPAAAKILWLGVGRGRPELAELQRRVEGVAVGTGHVAETRPFTPHLTLARLGRAQDLTHLVGEAPSLGISCPVDAVTLFESRPGPVYAPLRSWPLSVTMG